MRRKLLIRPEAEADIVTAHNWYKLQAEGLGTEFLRAVDACLSAIERNPLAYPLIHKQVRRSLIRKFPYAIFYLIEIEEDEDLSQPVEKIVVLACFHAKRDPKQWQKRVT
ncbi:MAG: type II toxin-antitoxin system RelE/ParE family toxin [Armatimonadota bacterium]|nr:type II toxin-antitoxin system RelE/ParE family toxin [Armatimonadota bacterium]